MTTTSVFTEEELLIIELRNRVTKIDAFNQVRGELGGMITRLEGLMFESGDADTFSDRVGRMFGQGPVMTMSRLMAELSHAGQQMQSIEYRALRAALMDPAFIFPGEAFAPGNCTPVTFTLLHPRAFSVVTKWYMHSNKEQLFECDEGKWDERTRALHALLTTLARRRDEIREESRKFAQREAEDEWSLMNTDLLGLRDCRFAGQYPDIQIAPPPKNWQYGCLLEKAWVDFMVANPIVGASARTSLSLMKSQNRIYIRNTHVVYVPRVARLELDKSASTIAEKLENRRQVSLWDFSVPSGILPNIKRNSECREHVPFVGMHGEDEHGHWKTRYPSLVSRNIEKGFGAIILLTSAMVREYQNINHGVVNEGQNPRFIFYDENNDRELWSM
jgi:hypothetical protein